MTRQDVREAPAGRRLNALVAERLMGFTDVVSWADGVVRGRLPGSFGTFTVPDYGMIDAAMEVLCKARGSERRPFTISGDGDRYVCAIHDADGLPWACQGATISEAICRAALLMTTEEP